MGSTTSKDSQTQIRVEALREKKVAASEQTTIGDAGPGLYSLTMVTRRNDNGGYTHTFKVTELKTKSERIIYEERVGGDVTFELPLNSWSPDNKYLFLKKSTSGNQSFLVLHADGSNFTDGQKYLDVTAYWSESKPKFNLKSATGWAANDLMMITTTKEDGSDGPSFWFVIATHKFMQLAH